MDRRLSPRAELAEPGRMLPSVRRARSDPVCAMGISFPSALGLAAGIDRTGALVPALAAAGFGHIEVGTVSQAAELAAFPTSVSVPVGFNIGSARRGLDAWVIADYVCLFNRVASVADYVVANLSSPRALRDGYSLGVDRLIGRLAEARHSYALRTGRRVPLLVKLDGGLPGTPVPPAVVSASGRGFDGVILVCSRLSRISELADPMRGAALISVGGILTPQDIEARLSAGASLVQVHGAFVRGGLATARALLRP